MKTLIILLITIITTFACSTRIMPSSEVEQIAQNKEIIEGQQAFMESCHRCHPSGNAGLGPSLINKPIPGFLIKMQVRKGLGVMPSFDKEHLSEEKLDKLIAYIKELE